MSQPAAVMNAGAEAERPDALREAGPGLAIGAVVLVLLFHAEAVTAVTTWTVSTAYNHCFLVIPIVLFLLWDRRASLHGLTIAPLPVAAVAVLPLSVAWLAAERLGIMEGRQLIAMSMLEVLFLAVLGWRIWRALLGPLLYLYFLVPFGDFLTPALQDVTTWFTRHGLELLGIAAYVDGHIIEIPEGTFFVAEACAGLRFLIASIAFGVLYALLMYRSPLRRMVFVATAIIVPVLANGIRALGIVVLGHVLGSAQAAAADHVLYGWLFFSLVILLLLGLGLPFRQDDQPPSRAGSPMPPQPGTQRAALRSGLAVAAMAALGPAVALGLDTASAMPQARLRPLDPGSACVNRGNPVSPAAQLIVQLVSCDTIAMTIAIEVFPSRSTAAAVNAERRRLTRSQGGEDMSEAPVLTQSGQPLPGWRFVLADGSGFVAAASVWLDGRPAWPGLGMRLRMAEASVTGVTYAPVLLVVTPVADWSRIDLAGRGRLQRQIAAWLEANPGIGGQVRAVSRIRP